MNKFFFFDMDGTIVDENSNISPEIIKALHEARAKGHKLAIATGRPQNDILRDTNPADFDYLIANNGTYYYDVKADKFTYNGAVAKNIAYEMLEKAKETNSMFAVHCNGGAYRIDFDGIFKMEDINNDPNGLKFEYYDEETIKAHIEKYEIAQVSLRNSIDKIEDGQKELQAKYDNAEFHIANGVYLDCNPKGISKLHGVEAVLEKEGMTLEQAVTFGDSGNDIHMIEGAGLGIAMGNATDSLKEMADEVIGDNNTDAIADKLRELI